MNTKLLLVLLACFTATHCFTCPDAVSHHVDVSTGCQVYHVCVDSQIVTLACPSGQAFSVETLECEDASTVNCTELASYANSEKYLTTTTKSVEQIRRKRQISLEMPGFATDIFSSALGQFMLYIADQVTNSIVGDGDSLLSKVVLPTIYEIRSDKESKFNALKLFTALQFQFSRLAHHAMKGMEYDTKEGTIVSLPRSMWEESVKGFLDESLPIVWKMVRKHGKAFFYKMGDNIELLISKVDSIIRGIDENTLIFKDTLRRFGNKHMDLFRSSNSTHVYFYNPNEILQDLTPVGVTFAQVLMKHVRNDPKSILNALSGENSYIRKAIVGEPVYAEPRPETVKMSDFLVNLIPNNKPVYAKPKPETTTRPSPVPIRRPTVRTNVIRNRTVSDEVLKKLIRQLIERLS